MSAMDRYREAWMMWRRLPTVTVAGRQELERMYQHPEELRRGFAMPLAIEDGRVVGELGEGPARLNETMVAWLVKSFGLLVRHDDRPSLTVVLAGDGRKKHRDFLTLAAELLGAMGLHIVLAGPALPAPVFARTVRRLRALGGIYFGGEGSKDTQCLTFYDPDGAVLTDTAALKEIYQKHVYGTEVRERSEMEELIALGQAAVLPTEMAEHHLRDLASEPNGVFAPYLPLYPTDSLRVLYSPLYGSCRKSMAKALETAGVKELRAVKSQAAYDPEMTTAPDPDLRDAGTYLEGMLSAYVMGPDLLMLLDPAGRYVGCAVRHEGDYQFLSGQQIAVLIFDFMASHRVHRNGDTVVTAFGTTPLLKGLALRRQYQVRETDRHFGALGRLAAELREAGAEVLLAVDDRSGIMVGDGCGYEPDGLLAAMLLAKAGLAARSRGTDLLERLGQLEAECGAVIHDDGVTVSVGAPAREVIAALAGTPAAEILGQAAPITWDFQRGSATLPPMPMLHYQLSEWTQVQMIAEENDRFLRLAVSAEGDDRANARRHTATLINTARKAIQATDRRLIAEAGKDDGPDPSDEPPSDEPENG